MSQPTTVQCAANAINGRQLRRSVAGWLAVVTLATSIAGNLAAEEPAPDASEKTIDSAAEEWVIDPAFSAELFRKHDQPQKTLPDDEEAVAGDGGKMPLDEEAEGAAEAAPTTTVDDKPAPSGDNLTPELRDLRDKVRKTLGSYYRRKLNTRDHTPWEVFHQIIAYGTETQVRKGGPKGPPVDAVRWLCDNRTSHGQKLMYLDRGQLALGRAKGIQGHYGQFLAILAQHDIPRDYAIEFDGRRFTVEDLIATEQRTCRAGEELTFKLIAFMHYLEPGAEWKNDRGETWTVERILRDEIDSPIRGAACGGTHRLMGLSYAVRRREELEQPMDGQYGRAQQYLLDYHRYAFSLQNDDGSFSTEWFTGRGNRDNRDRKLQTSGHITEWLAYSLPEEHLRDPRMVRAIDFLATLLNGDRQAEWAIGPMGHSLHALALYDERVFIAAEEAPAEIAAVPQAPKLDRLVIPDNAAPEAVSTESQRESKDRAMDAKTDSDESVDSTHDSDANGDESD